TPNWLIKPTRPKAESLTANIEKPLDGKPNQKGAHCCRGHLLAACPCCASLHRNPTHCRRWHGHSRANDGVRHRYSLRGDDGSTRLCADRNHARRKGRAQVEGEVRQRRAQRCGTT